MSRSPEEIFRSAMAAVAAGDIDAVLEHYHLDCIFTDMTEGVSRSHGELRAYLEDYYAHLPIDALRGGLGIEHLGIVSVVVEGDRLAGEIEVEGRYVGEGAAPGGTPISLHYVVLDRYEDGRIMTETVYSDSAEFTNQLGG